VLFAAKGMMLAALALTTTAAATESRNVLCARVKSSDAQQSMRPVLRLTVLCGRYIVFDDLRPDLSAYGQKHMHTPNIQRLADTGLTFERAYCQEAVCSPSRNSFATGRRPNGTKVWNLCAPRIELVCANSHRDAPPPRPQHQPLSPSRVRPHQPRARDGHADARRLLARVQAGHVGDDDDWRVRAVLHVVLGDAELRGLDVREV
jgi:hypothetical protein